MQVFHFVRPEIAVLMTPDPLQRVECACVGCRNITNAIVGKLVSFDNGTEEHQYRLFDSLACALETMPVEFMNQA